MDYQPNEITFAHISILNNEAGQIAAGVELSKRRIAEDGRPYYDLYHVLSLYYTGSIRQKIPVIAADILRCVDPETKRLVMRSNVPHFRQWRYYERLINVFAASRGVAVKINYDIRVPRKFPDTVKLADDAGRRGVSLDCAL
ncbi:hypothetical protein ACL02P_12700 [Paenibacillus sp. MB22_1]|uniref:hypothetical protein n=1 Tax=Paenibacillus sp. MB22_1 TaxID=3383121 RepID=UPI0039A1E293